MDEAGSGGGAGDTRGKLGRGGRQHGIAAYRVTLQRSQEAPSSPADRAKARQTALRVMNELIDTEKRFVKEMQLALALAEAVLAAAPTNSREGGRRAGGGGGGGGDNSVCGGGEGTEENKQRGSSSSSKEGRVFSSGCGPEVVAYFQAMRAYTSSSDCLLRCLRGEHVESSFADKACCPRVCFAWRDELPALLLPHFPRELHDTIIGFVILREFNFFEAIAREGTRERVEVARQPEWKQRMVEDASLALLEFHCSGVVSRLAWHINRSSTSMRGLTVGHEAAQRFTAALLARTKRFGKSEGGLKRVKEAMDSAFSSYSTQNNSLSLEARMHLPLCRFARYILLLKELRKQMLRAGSESFPPVTSMHEGGSCGGGGDQERCGEGDANALARLDLLLEQLTAQVAWINTASQAAAERRKAELEESGQKGFIAKFIRKFH